MSDPECHVNVVITKMIDAFVSGPTHGIKTNMCACACFSFFFFPKGLLLDGWSGWALVSPVILFGTGSGGCLCG